MRDSRLCTVEVRSPKSLFVVITVVATFAGITAFYVLLNAGLHRLFGYKDVGFAYLMPLVLIQIIVLVSAVNIYVIYRCLAGGIDLRSYNISYVSIMIFTILFPVVVGEVLLASFADGVTGWGERLWNTLPIWSDLLLMFSPLVVAVFAFVNWISFKRSKEDGSS